jgi:hypothetical protein
MRLFAKTVSEVYVLHVMFFNKSQKLKEGRTCSLYFRFGKLKNGRFSRIKYPALSWNMDGIVLGVAIQ